ncbi:MAG: hypothetical protein HQL91_03185 [Magnetococcales bacterium]|nr:hypothetical protein [Magnetococcales bacterium]
MLQAVHAEVDEKGQVRLLEPILLPGRHRAILTVLDPLEKECVERLEEPKGSHRTILRFLEENPLSVADRLSAEEMEAQIREEREGWN